MPSLAADRAEAVGTPNREARSAMTIRNAVHAVALLSLAACAHMDGGDVSGAQRRVDPTRVTVSEESYAPPARPSQPQLVQAPTTPEGAASPQPPAPAPRSSAVSDRNERSAPDGPVRVRAAPTGRVVAESLPLPPPSPSILAEAPARAAGLARFDPTSGPTPEGKPRTGLAGFDPTR